MLINGVASSGRFPTTRWTLILNAQAGEVPRHAALEELLARYWRPVYLYVRRKGLDADRAQDAVQGLFAQLLEREFLDRLDPARGRFRSFLRKAADNYLSHERERQRALKRGGPERALPLDPHVAEELLAAAPEDPTAAFDREWALGVMERALERLRIELEAGRGAGSAAVLLGFFGPEAPRSYVEAAAAAGMSLSQFRAALHRARVRFRGLLLEEVGDTVAGDPSAELRALFQVLAT